MLALSFIAHSIIVLHLNRMDKKIITENHFFNNFNFILTFYFTLYILLNYG